MMLVKVFMDVISLFLVMLLASPHRSIHLRVACQWLLAIFLLSFIFQKSAQIDSTSIHFLLSDFPIQRVQELIGLVFLTLLMNSFILKAPPLEVIFITMLGFVIWFLTIFLSIAITSLFSINLFLARPSTTLLLTIALYWLVNKKLFVYFQQSFNHFFKLMIVTVFVFLIYMFFSIRTQNELLIQPVFFLFVVLILFATLGWLLYEQKKTQVIENRMKVIEKYIPIIDELVGEVRSRQHEFSNKLLAISSILQSTENMNEVREQVSKYVENVQLSRGQYELLNMDHKVVAGFLYTKMKRAEQLNMKLIIERSVSVSSFPCEDYDLIEVLGILIDNAIEACYGGDTITIRMGKERNRYELTVTNPGEYITNEQFMKLFKMGYSTKSTFSTERGFGLYNVKQIAKKYNGNIITRNEFKDENMITIGIQF